MGEMGDGCDDWTVTIMKGAARSAFRERVARERLPCSVVGRYTEETSDTTANSAGRAIASQAARLQDQLVHTRVADTVHNQFFCQRQVVHMLGLVTKNHHRDPAYMVDIDIGRFQCHHTIDYQFANRWVDNA